MTDGRQVNPEQNQSGAKIPSMTPFEMLQLALVIRKNLKVLKKIHGTIYSSLNPTELVSTLIHLSTFLAQQGTNAPSFNVTQLEAIYVVEKALVFLAEDLQQIQKIADSESPQKAAIEIGEYSQQVLKHVYCLTYCATHFPGPLDTDATITGMAVHYAGRQAVEDVKESFLKFKNAIKEKMNEVKFGMHFYSFLDDTMKEIEKSNMMAHEKENALSQLKAIKYHRGRNLKTVYPDQIRDLSNFWFQFHEKLPHLHEQFETTMNEACPAKLAAFYLSVDEIQIENNSINNRINEGLRKIYNQELEKLVKRKEELELKISSEEKNVDGIKKEIMELNQLIKENQAKIDKLFKPLSTDEKEKNTKELQRLKEKENDLKTEYDKAGNRFNELESKMKSVQQTKKIKSYDKEITDISRRIETFKVAVKEVEKRKIDPTFTKEKRKTELEKLNKEIKKLKGDKKILESENKKYHKDSDIKELEYSMKKAKERLLELQIDIESNSKKRAHYEQSDKSLKETNDHYQKEIKELDVKMKNSTEEKNKIFTELQALKKEIATLEAKRPSVMKSPLAKVKRKKEEFQHGIKHLLEKIPFGAKEDKAHQEEHTEDVKPLKCNVPEAHLAIFQLQAILKSLLKQSGNKDNVELAAEVNALKEMAGAFLHDKVDDETKVAFLKKTSDCYLHILQHTNHKDYRKIQSLDGQLWRLFHNENMVSHHGPLFLMRKARNYQGGKHPRTVTALVEVARLLNERIAPDERIILNDHDIKMMVDKAIDAMNKKLVREGKSESKFSAVKFFGNNLGRDAFLRNKLEKRVRQAIEMEPRLQYEKPVLAISQP